MKTLTDNEIGMALLHLRDVEYSAACAEMDSAHNLNTNPMAVRCAGYKAVRLAFALGARLAESKMKPTMDAAEKLGNAFDNWYGESAHLCASVDLMKANTIGSHEAKGEVERLTALLNSSIHFNNLTRVEPPKD